MSRYSQHAEKKRRPEEAVQRERRQVEASYRRTV